MHVLGIRSFFLIFFGAKRVKGVSYRRSGSWRGNAYFCLLLFEYLSAGTSKCWIGTQIELGLLDNVLDIFEIHRRILKNKMDLAKIKKRKLEAPALATFSYPCWNYFSIRI